MAKSQYIQMYWFNLGYWLLVSKTEQIFPIKNHLKQLANWNVKLVQVD
jgi:hypothetical protein